jgi:hypothetical protein
MIVSTKAHMKHIKDQYIIDKLKNAEHWERLRKAKILFGCQAIMV